jgi:hypothetical protein
MQCQTEEDCAELTNQLPHTEASLLDWTINLMADVVQEEHLNKMNARNIAMVFAPNMTQVSQFQHLTQINFNISYYMCQCRVGVRYQHMSDLLNTRLI